jgi:hypothetical protein
MALEVGNTVGRLSHYSGKWGLFIFRLLQKHYQ